MRPAKAAGISAMSRTWTTRSTLRRGTAAHGEAVRAGLLLREAPLLLAPALRGGQLCEELRPLHAGLDFDQPALHVEAEHAVELADVDQDAVGSEGLSAHCVTAARDAHGALLAPGGGDRRARGIERLRFHHAIDAGRIELRVKIVDEDARGLRPRAGARPGSRQTGDLQELTAVGHVASFLSSERSVRTAATRERGRARSLRAARALPRRAGAPAGARPRCARAAPARARRSRRHRRWARARCGCA